LVNGKYYGQLKNWLHLISIIKTWRSGQVVRRLSRKQKIAKFSKIRKERERRKKEVKVETKQNLLERFQCTLTNGVVD